MDFVKMHGIGNDYIYIDCFKQPAPENPAELSIKLSAFHTGIGSDGIILILPCEGADARMRIFNKDGSEGEMCGNGIRCVGKYLYDSGIKRESVLNIMTLGGLKRLEMITEGGVATGARVNMGAPVFEPERIPLNAETNRVRLEAGGRQAEFFCLNMGNPHAVTSDIFPTDDEFETLGRAFELNAAFPNRANISFVKAVSATCLNARIWERGSGATLACGSGATATLVAAYKMGLCSDKASVRLPGGELFIEYDEKSGCAYMTGPAEISFVGTVTDKLI